MAQTTEANQPHVGGNIALASIPYLKFLTGETGTKGLTGTDIPFAASAQWTLIMALRNNWPRTGSRVYLSASNYIEMSATAITLVGNTGTVLTCPYVIRPGLTKIVEFQYNNAAGLIKINGVPMTTTTTSGAVTFGSLFCNQTANNFDGGVMYLNEMSARIGEADSARIYTYLRNLYPTRFGVAINNQFWDVENWDAVVTGNSTVIPEIQANTNSAELMSNPGFTDLFISEVYDSDAGNVNSRKISRNYLMY
jgi:hypothetical protein